MSNYVVELPSTEVIKYFIEVLRRLYPGDDILITNLSIIESALASAYYSVKLGSDYLSSLIYGVSRLFYELITLHPLIDGNKRLATLALTTTLIRNGLLVSKSVLKELAIEVAKGDLSFDDVCKYLRSSCKSLKSRLGWVEATELAIREFKEVLDELRIYDLSTD